MQTGDGVYAPDRLTCTNNVYVGRFRVLERPVFYVRKGTKMVQNRMFDGSVTGGVA